MQGLLKCDLRNHLIFNIRGIIIVLHVNSVSIITLMNKKKVKIEILHYISENFTLVQLMDCVGNVNHEVSIVVY